MVDTEDIERLGDNLKQVAETLSHLVIKPLDSRHAEQANTVKDGFKTGAKNLVEDVATALKRHRPFRR
ncbi:MAG TPA: hypothetical protein VEW42_06125 [Candidatus Eisenbacteria bacterium]|nr:hypothetical protein [Candidatus Eisenbacteria bacterium]